MRTVVYRGPQDLRVEDRPQPPLEEGEVRVAVRSSGVCGTDVRIYKGEHGAYSGVTGRVPGHEIVGHVVERAGAGPEVGQLVFVAPNIGCGTCRACKAGNENLCPSTDGIGITIDGGFAESVVVPARAVARGNLIPLETDDLDAAVLIEPLACVLRGQEQIGLAAGHSVLVNGGGPIGLLHVALAKALGASRVLCSEPSAPRRDAALCAGADAVIDPSGEDLAAVVAELTEGQGADVVITAAPVHATQTQALELAAVSGRVLFFAGLPKSRPTVEIDSNLIHYKELLISGTTASTLENCRSAAEILGSGRLDLSWMVSDVFGLEDFESAVAAVQDASALKVVLKPGS